MLYLAKKMDTIRKRNHHLLYTDYQLMCFALAKKCQNNSCLGAFGDKFYSFAGQETSYKSRGFYLNFKGFYIFCLYLELSGVFQPTLEQLLN